MPRVYSKAPKHVDNMMNAVLETFHKELVKVKLKIGILFVNSDGDEMAIMGHGVPCLAKIRIAGQAERVFCNLDVVLMVDEKAWSDLNDVRRRALLDHEVCHLVVVTDKNGNVRSHDGERPRMSLVPDDFVLTGFHAVIERHGADALELVALQSTVESVQQFFDFSRSAKTGPRLAAAESG